MCLVYGQTATRNTLYLLHTLYNTYHTSTYTHTHANIYVHKHVYDLMGESRVKFIEKKNFNT